MMGEAKRRQINDQEFKLLHPTCAYCDKATTTVDHFPPRAAFRDRKWPDDFRFPSCNQCNSGTSHEELVVSALVRMRLNGVSDDDYTLKLLEGVKNNRFDVMQEWFEPISRNEVRRRFRKNFGDKIGNELRRRGYGLVTYGEKTMFCLQVFGDKLIRALYFMHVGRRVDGLAYSSPFSVIEHREVVAIAASHAPFLHHTKHQNASLSDQFVYRINCDSEQGALFMVAQLGDQLAYFGHAFSKEFCDSLQREKPGALAEIGQFYEKAATIVRGSNVCV